MSYLVNKSVNSGEISFNNLWILFTLIIIIIITTAAFAYIHFTY